MNSKSSIHIIISLFILFFLSACGENNSDSISQNNTTKCDTIIDKNYYKICYDYKLKSALFVMYTLDGSLVDNPNITDRPSFYPEPNLPTKYQSHSNDYIGSGYDKGHLASDASFDYSQSSLDSVYSMANIIPQYPDVNRYAWIDTEKLERQKAKEFQKVKVIIGVDFSDNPQKIGADEISVAKGFYKKISTFDNSYKECFYYENIPYDVANDSLKQHKISCSSLNFKF